ncbi:unnamed protein product [Trichogramma brassicae]|uniref:Uncharacterized protein n=1 Tax=Trichogramma brassicae TaxID=86971 RepID=A0A6H5IFV9_9HYME|nr:unnamed protein product [Trichogramma brassicae]
MSQEEDADPEKATVYVTDESSLLRHQILLNGYTVRLRRSEILSTPEEARLFSTLPPPQGCCIDDEPIVAATKHANRSDRIDENEEEEEDDNSELGLWLRDTGPGLRDEFWITQTRRAHKSSPNAMKHTVFLELLNQMEQAIPTVEWVDRFKWDPELSCDNDEYWLPEEKLALQLVLHYGLARGFVVESDDTEKNLKTFIRSTHDYINYNKSSTFEGFDWFLATMLVLHLYYTKVLLIKVASYMTTNDYVAAEIRQLVSRQRQEKFHCPSTAKSSVNHLAQVLLTLLAKSLRKLFKFV